MLFRRLALCALIFCGAGVCTELGRPHPGPFRFEEQWSPHALASSSDGKQIVSVNQARCGDVLVHRWTVASGERIDMCIKNPQPYGYWSGIPDFPGPTLSVSADGQVAAFAGDPGTIFVCDTGSGRLLHRFQTGTDSPLRSECSVLSPDGKLLVGLGSSELLVLEISSGRTLGTIPGDNLHCVHFSADHQTLVVPDSPGKMAVWRVHPFKKLVTLELPAPWEGFARIALAPDGKTFVAQCELQVSTFRHRASLVWWDTRTAGVIRQQENLGMGVLGG